jgi:heat shock protein HslJ
MIPYPPRGPRGLLPLLSFGLLACGPEARDESLESLENRVFLSERLIDVGAPRSLAPGTRLSLRFDEAEGMDFVQAGAGCNSWSGFYTLDEGMLAVTDAASTIRGCNLARGEQDYWYFAFLGSCPSVDLGGHELVLDGDDGTRIEYRDEVAATPDLDLEVHVWTVDSVVADGIAMHGPWAAPATLVFESDGTANPNHTAGTVAFETGCNIGSGTYVAGWDLSFADLTVTQHVCHGNADLLDDAVLRVLGSQDPRWEITIDRLWLSTEGVELELVARRG